jgi:UPF0042 nucleotide-binding protein
MTKRLSPQKTVRRKPVTRAARIHRRQRNADSRLVILTGLSGSGKVSALKVFEDLGYYCVDNLPAELIPSFAELVIESTEPLLAAMVVDIREGSRLDQIPAVIGDLKQRLNTRLLFLECEDSVLLRRFSETRRPHPLGNSGSVKRSIHYERRRLEPIKNLSDIILDTRSSMSTSCATTSQSSFGTARRSRRRS